MTVGTASLATVATAFGRRALQIAVSYRIPFLGELIAAAALVGEMFFVSRIVPASEVTGGYFAFATAGFVVIGFLAAAVATLALAIREEQTQGTLELLIVSGVQPRRMVLGLAAYPLAEAAARSIVYVLMAALFGAGFDLHGVPLAILSLAIGSASFVGLGLIGGAVVIVFRRATAGAAWIVGIATFASGVVFPTRVLPDWLRPLSAVSPVTITLDLVRGALLGGLSLAQAWPRLLVLIAMAGAALLLGVVSVERGLGWARRKGTLGQY